MTQQQPESSRCSSSSSSSRSSLVKIVVHNTTVGRKVLDNDQLIDRIMIKTKIIMPVRTAWKKIDMLFTKTQQPESLRNC
jgi:hypothetical protein